MTKIWVLVILAGVDTYTGSSSSTPESPSISTSLIYPSLDDCGAAGREIVGAFPPLPADYWGSSPRNVRIRTHCLAAWTTVPQAAEK